MKYIQNTIISLMVFIMTVGFFPVVVYSQTVLQDDKRDRRNYKIGIDATERIGQDVVIPPQNDRVEQKRYEMSLKNKNFNTSLREDRKDRREYIEIKEAYKNRVEVYKNQKSAFLQARDQYKVAKESEKLAEKAIFETRAYAFLNASVEILVKKLERIKIWVTNHPQVADSVEASVVADLDAQIDALLAITSNLIEDKATAQEIVDSAKAVRARMSSYNDTVRRVVTSIKASRFEDARVKIKVLVDALSERMVILSEQGYDMTEARLRISDIEARITSSTDRESFSATYNMLKDLVNHLKQVVSRGLTQ